MPSRTGDRLAAALSAGLVGFAIGVMTGTAIGGEDHRPVHSARLEDEPGWSCVDDGNRICGPGNSEGKPAGCYDAGGVMVAPWPCHVRVDAGLEQTGGLG